MLSEGSIVGCFVFELRLQALPDVHLLNVLFIKSRGMGRFLEFVSVLLQLMGGVSLYLFLELDYLEVGLLQFLLQCFVDGHRLLRFLRQLLNFGLLLLALLF